MKAVILAAGEGRRLEPLTDRRPKPMIPVANRPILEYVVEAVAGAGVSEVVLVVGYGRDRIQTHFGDGRRWDVAIEYAVQDPRLGTGHAVLQAEPFVDDDFLVLNGDAIVEADLVCGLLEARSPAMVVARADDPGQYGVVDVAGDRVTDIVEKPRGDAAGVINAGAYRLSPSAFDTLRAVDPDGDGERPITDAIARLVAESGAGTEGSGPEGGASAEIGTADSRRGGVRAVRYRGQWVDVSFPWDLPAVTGRVIDRRGGEVHPNARVADGAAVADATAVDAGASVGPNATVRRGTALGANVSVGPGAVLSNAVVLPDATVESGAVLADCVVGSNARVGANATLAGAPADVVVDDRVHREVPLGAAVGDNAVLEQGVVATGGTVVGDGAVVRAGATVDGRVPADAEVVR